MGFETEDDDQPSQTSQRMQLAMIPIMVILNKVEITEGSDRLMWIRITFASMVFANVCLYIYIWAKVGEAKDETEIYAMPPKGKSMAQSNDPERKKYKKTTYLAVEKERCSGKLSDAVIGACISSLISWYFKIPHALIFQMFNLPQSAWECPLFKIYVRKSVTDKKQDRPFNEKYEGEDLRLNSQIKAEKKEKEKERVEQEKLFDDAMEACWQSTEDLETMYEDLIEVVEDVGVNYKQKEDGRTVVMQVAGTNIKTSGVHMDTLLQMSPDLSIKDNDGWTAIHWASFHGNSGALTKLLQHDREVSTRALKLKDEEGMTPLQLTKDQKNADCSKAIEKYVKDNKIDLGAEEEEESETKSVE